MPPRPCLTCGKPTNNTRCPTCQQPRDRARNQSRTHLTGNWPTLSRTIRQAHVEQHGWTCPGWQVPAHPSTDLTVDHIQQRSGEHGYQVLCRSCNARKSVNERNTPPT